MTGFAVTGPEAAEFADNRTDRVCEVGVVLVVAEGWREDSWTTLVNPQRDLGAQRVVIHWVNDPLAQRSAASRRGDPG